MTTHGDPEPDPDSSEPRHERTLDRALVHKAAVSEVFVTDVRPTGERTVRTAVQLPLVHAYYNDHVQSPATHDALLLLEAGRQAAIAGTHAHMRFDHDTTMIVDRFTFALDDLKALVIGPQPGSVLIDTEYIGEPNRAGRYRKGRVAQRYLVGGEPVGEHVMDVLFLRHRENDALRRAQRGTPAPLTSDYEDARPGDDPRRVAPERVGRVHPLNVVLAGELVDEAGVSAEFTPSFRNRSLFDHVYDHLPAMTLVEGARQLALLSLDAPRTTHTVGIAAHFARFAELDDTVRLSAPRPGPPDEEGRVTLPVTFHQNGAEIASVTMTMGSLL
ncbi:AfsA-related hotdog domain-containing protein [Streptomyces sp. NPDC127098]|uniref:AfsA-related hotdog domain-containing protein n=1 Tax=Streptomyces sp. NPDC127098 TaxID=3347137 RepID=UPI00365B483F